MARLLQTGHTVQALVAHSLAAIAGAYAVSRGLPVAKLVLPTQDLGHRLIEPAPAHAKVTPLVRHACCS